MSQRIGKAKRNLYLDVASGIGYLVALYPAWTGLQWHEWLGVAIGGALLTHLLLHWRWVMAITKRLLGKLAARARIRYVVDGALLIAFLALMGSGVVISSVFEMPYRLGLSIGAFAFWIRVHAISSDVTVALVSLHLALHWRWIAENVKRLFLRRRRMESQRAAAKGNVVAKSSAATGRAEAMAD